MRGTSDKHDGVDSMLPEKPENAQFVMLNLFQHLINKIRCETLKQVQGDRKRLFQQPDRRPAGQQKSLPTTYYLLPTEQGIALVIALMISLAVMILIISTLYFVIQSTSMSGAGKRYATASEAADGAVEVMKDAVNLVLLGEPVDALPISDNDPPCLLNAVFSDNLSCTTTLTLPGTVGDFNASIVIMRLYSSPIPGGRIEFARAGGGAPTTAIYYLINTVVTGQGGTRAETTALYRYAG